ncbi:HAD-IA family hydrolase [Hydromonas duriensis]|uniref:Phosphoglycolate phosphatase n=1 Tax=Hydromonas duriensis TaxID=1527608 RepID=A0A4R6Y373_9BURK|nr:HAD-IA family hydrolase [Hydromonas duriensis]TDR30805.1 phosphoglycolate phosphatase [Hydromonas duriensis]
MNPHLQPAPSAVLFDLDGTLVDSAPDLAGAVNALRVRRGLTELPLAQLRPFASQGARGLLGAGMGITPEHNDFEMLRDEFLDYYETHCCVHSHLFDGVEEVLQWLESHHLPWGIITNKHTRFTTPLVQALGLDARAAVIISGDTTAHAKPHPLPLQHAANILKRPVEQLIYVGDDARDIEAARAAHYMSAFAAAYGYCQPSEVATWHADAILNTPTDILKLLK